MSRTDGEYNRHATVGQLREVLGGLPDTDCVHTNAVGNLTVIRRTETGDDHIGYIELTSGDDDQPPAATFRPFGRTRDAILGAIAELGDLMPRSPRGGYRG